MDTFAAHREHKIEYGSKADTVMRFAQNTQYNIDAVRKESFDRWYKMKA